jgi:ketosteroid isomerase-like protein
MRRRRMAMLVALALIAGCAADQEPARLTADEKSALRFVTDWCAAYSTNDTAALDRILADDYVLTGGTGKMTTKADALESTRKKAVRYSRVENRDMKARVHGDTAVVTGRTLLAGTRAGGASFEIEIRFTDTLVRDGKSWKGLAAHVSRLTP